MNFSTAGWKLRQRKMPSKFQGKIISKLTFYNQSSYQSRLWVGNVFSDKTFSSHVPLSWGFTPENKPLLPTKKEINLRHIEEGGREFPG